MIYRNFLKKIYNFFLNFYKQLKHLSSSSCTCRCRCLGAMGGCVISIRHFDFRHLGAVFIYALAIQNSKIYMIKNNKLNQLSSIYCRI